MIRWRAVTLAVGALALLLVSPVHARPFFPSVGSVRGTSTVRVPVILYHYVRTIPLGDQLGAKLSIDPEQFKSQLLFLLKSGYAPISPDHLYAALQSKVQLPDNPIVITFDDGTEDFATTVFPILNSYGVLATVYVIPAFVGTPGYMSWQQLRDVAASPIVTIGSHGLNHVPLTSLPRDVARRQLILTKNILSTVTGQPIRTFAYPNGQYNKDIASMAGDAGYTTAFTTRKGVDHSVGNRLEAPRLHAGSSVVSLQRALTK